MVPALIRLTRGVRGWRDGFGSCFPSTGERLGHRPAAMPTAEHKRRHGLKPPPPLLPLLQGAQLRLIFQVAHR